MSTSAWMWGGFFSQSEICSKCGQIKITTRFFGIPSSQIQETELSKFIDTYHRDKLRELGNHKHIWLFVRGGGSIQCALGKGRHLYRAARSIEVKNALEKILQYKGRKEVDKWLNYLFDLKSSSNSSLFFMFLNENCESQENFESGYKEAYSYLSSLRNNS